MLLQSSFRSNLLAAALIITAPAFAQVVGGRGNGQSTPSEVKASELSKGAYSADVNLFSGTFNSSYSFGSVSTPSGLSYSLTMDYASSYSGGDNVPVVSGVPYGEGWSMSVPSIHISTEAFNKYTESQLISFNSNKSDTHCIRINNQDALTEGRLLYFAPVISIPGVVNERFVFKYYDENNSVSVFVPAKFGQYIEARFTGNSWSVVTADGTVYFFGLAQTAARNASNQRVYKDFNTGVDISENITVASTLMLPKNEVLAWYCTAIQNPNHPAGQQIGFEYEKFGSFNYFKEYLQPRIATAMQLAFDTAYNGYSQWYNGTGEVAENGLMDFITYKDVFLKKVTARSWDVTIESIELDYKTLFTTGTPELMLPNQQGVSRMDSLYNYKTVYSWGVQGGQSPESTLMGSAVSSSGFSNWNQYYHIKSDNAKTLGNASTNTFTSAQNPYIGHIDGQDPSDPAHYFMDEAPMGNNITFNHSFIESPRIGGDLPPGDVYELKALIINSNSTGASERFCNFDINVCSGSEPTSGYSYYNSRSNFPIASSWNVSRSVPIYSTFNQAVKWNSLATDANSSYSSYMVMRAQFALPNLPNEFDGFNIQIGPGISDHEFSLDESEVSPTPISSFRAYYNYRYHTPNFNPLTANDLEPCDAIPQNFGIGMPWHMARRLYAFMDNSDTSTTADRYKFWWNDSPPPNSSQYPWDNKPTRADENVLLGGVELVRYSKNPYMLSGVKHYRINGDESTPTLVNSYKLEYDLQQDSIINNRIYSSTQPKAYKCLRNVYLLRRVRQLPTNPTVPATPPTYTLSEVPTTHFEYTKMFNTFIRDTVRTNANLWALTKYTDQLGGEVSVSYYPLSDSRTTVVDRYVYKNPLAENFNVQALVQKAPSRAIQVSLIVKSKTVTGETGQSFAKTWDYDFQNKVNHFVQPTLPQQFRVTMLEVEHGFANVTVTQPQLKTNVARAKTKHYHRQSDLFWGKLYKSMTFDENNLINEFSATDYDTTEAYGNGMYRNSFTHSTADGSDYAGLTAPPSGFQFTNYYGSITFARNGIQNLEAVYPAFFPATYLNSYFVKTAKSHATSYEYNPLAPINSNSGYNSGDTSTSAPEQKNWYSITSVSEYEYWEANKYGVTTSNGFKQLLPTFTGSSLSLSYEPSWMLYRTKTYSPQQQDAYAASENFFYYDLKNFLNGTPLDFDAVVVCQQQGIRSIPYEIRSTAKAGNQLPVSNSKYFWYDFKWNTNPSSYIPVQNDTIDGVLECPGFTPDTTNYDCIKYYGQPAPPGYVLTTDPNSGQLWYCPTADGQPHAQDIITAPGDPPPPLPNVGSWLVGKLFFRQEITAVDSMLVDTLYTNIQNARILRFAETTGSPATYYPVYPFDTIGTYYVSERNELGQEQLVRNERNLYTKFYTTNPYRIWHVDPNDPCNSYLSTYYYNIGLPVAVTQGFGEGDSLHSSFVFYPDNSVQRMIDPNGLQTEYTYDIYGRMYEAKADGKKRTQVKYHQWTNNFALSFNQRAAENYISSYTLNNDSSTVAERRVCYLDPLGRVYVNAVQVSPNYISNALDSVSIFSGQVTYDNWSRGTQTFKPFRYNDPNSSTTSIDPKLNTTTSGAPQDVESVQYELNQRGRTLQVANFGQTLNGGYTVNTAFIILTASQLVSELGLSNSEFSDVTGVAVSGNTSLLRFGKSAVTDQDGKRTISYTNALGQKIAAKQYIDQTTYATTLFAFNSTGQVRKVINPEKQNTTYKYNHFGWLYEKQTVDNGITRYMYDASGNVVLEEDANLRTGWDNGYDPEEGQCHGCEEQVQLLRYYEYDKFGRITSQSRVQWYLMNPLNNVWVSSSSSYRLTFSSATTIDRTFNLEQLSVSGWQRTGLSMLLSTPGTLEKTFTYHNANSTLAGSTGSAFLSSHPQQKLQGRLATTTSYLQNGVPNQKRWFSYDTEGRSKYNLVVFDETNLGSSVTRTDAIWYDTYNLRGSLKQQRVDEGADGSTDMQYNYGYDGFNRMATMQVNNEKVAEYEYIDELGLVKQVKYFATDTCSNTAIQVDTVRYTYDVRDRLTQLKSFLFEENLYYDNNHPQANDTSYKVVASKNWNGNINATKADYYMQRAANYNDITDLMDGSTYYGFTYDGLNRLTDADASVMNVLTDDPSIPGNVKRMYGDENLRYDKIGNILTLQRGLYYEPTNGSPANVVQQWQYVYVSGKNRLQRVDSTAVTLRSYSYDANGNIRSDSYRSVGSMAYSRANLPTVLVVNGEEVKYQYDVSDQRVFKFNRSTNKKEYYLHDADGNTLLIADLVNTANKTWYARKTYKISTDGGNIAKTFSISDHLGNTRVTYSAIADCNTTGATVTVNQALDYFPFGKRLRAYYGVEKEKYQFNGNERDKETEWDYFGARYYDNEICKFLSIDPLAEESYNHTPYSFSANNPVLNVDVNGEKPFPYNHRLLKKNDFLKMAYNAGVDPTRMSNLRFNKIIGYAFEQAFIDARGLKRNQQTENGVKLDVVLPAVYYHQKRFGVDTWNPITASKGTIETFENVIGYEIKGTGKPVGLTKQIRGEIDLLASSVGNQGTKATDLGIASLTIVTFGDNYIKKTVVNYAKSKNVTLNWISAYQNTTTNQITFSPAMPLYVASHPYTAGPTFAPFTAGLLNFWFQDDVDPNFVKAGKYANTPIGTNESGLDVDPE